MALNPKRVFAYLKAAPIENAPADLLTRPFAGKLLVTLAHDFGDGFGLLQQRHLAELGMSEEQVFELGLRNLAAFAESGAVKIDQSSRVFAFIAGGNFEASLLLVDKLWHSMSGRIGSVRLVARVPARDLLLVSPADDEGCAELDRMAQKLAEFPLDNKLTDEPLHWDGKAWAVGS